MTRLPPPFTDADLNAYVDGELAPERRAEIEAYLIAEPAQAARVETWRRQNEIIRAVFAKIAREPLPLSLALALTRAPAARREPASGGVQHAADEPIRVVPRAGASRSEQMSRLAGVAVAAFAAGALVTMVAAELSGMTGGPPSEAVPRTTPVFSAMAPLGELVASRAIEAYHTYAPDRLRPVEIEASRRKFLIDWLSRRIGFTIQAPDLSGNGLKLLGGRLTPGEWGPAAFLLYETSSGNRIGLFISRAAADQSPRLRYVEERSASAVYWLGDGVGYALAGTAGRERLMRIARGIIGEPQAAAAP